MSEFENCGTFKEDTNMNFSEYLDFWFKEYVEINCMFNTQRIYKEIIKNHLKPGLGVYKLKNLSPATIQKFVNSKHINGLSKSSVSKNTGYSNK